MSKLGTVQKIVDITYPEGRFVIRFNHSDVPEGEEAPDRMTFWEKTADGLVQTNSDRVDEFPEESAMLKVQTMLHIMSLGGEPSPV